MSSTERPASVSDDGNCLSLFYNVCFLWITNHINKLWPLLKVDYLLSQLLSYLLSQCFCACSSVYRCSWTIVARTGKNIQSTGRFWRTKRYYIIEEVPTYFFITFKVQSFCDSRTSVMIACLFLRRTRHSEKRNWRPLRVHEEDLRNRLRNQYSLSNLARNPKSPFNEIERQIFVRLSCYLFLLY